MILNFWEKLAVAVDSGLEPIRQFVSAADV